MATLVVDATKPIVIKNPVVKSLKDIEGSPVPLDAPLTVTEFNVAVANPVGDFGSVQANEDGTFTFNPGTEIQEQASGDLVFTGKVEIDGESKDASGTLSVELQPGSPSQIGEIEAELEVIE